MKFKFIHIIDKGEETGRSNNEIIDNQKIV